MKENIRSAIQQIIQGSVYSQTQLSKLNLQQQFTKALSENNPEKAQEILEEDKGKTIHPNRVLVGYDFRVLVPLEYALEGGKEATEYMKELGGYNDFHIALIQGKSRKELEAMLEAHPEYNCPDANGNPALFFAVRHGDINIFNWFLEKFPEQIDLRNNDGDTVILMCGLFSPPQEITARLLELRPELIKTTDHDGNTVIEVAAYAGQAQEIIQLVKKFGASLDGINTYNQTAFISAAFNAQESALHALSNLNCTIDGYHITSQEVEASLENLQFNIPDNTTGAQAYLESLIDGFDPCITPTQSPTPSDSNIGKAVGITAASIAVICALGLVGKCLSGRNRDAERQPLLEAEKEGDKVPSEAENEVEPGTSVFGNKRAIQISGTNMRTCPIL